jgi:CheY-specific phosphatase CheX
MWSDLDITLYSTAANTLESLGFMFTGLVTTYEQLAAPPHLSAGVHFEGPFEGSVYITLCGGVLKQVTRNMLGEGEPPTDADQRDALGELANVICGNLLPQIGGKEAMFQVNTPFILGDHNIQARLGKPVAQAEVGLEAGRAEIALYISKDDRSN